MLKREINYLISIRDTIFRDEETEITMPSEAQDDRFYSTLVLFLSGINCGELIDELFSGELADITLNFDINDYIVSLMLKGVGEETVSKLIFGFGSTFALDSGSFGTNGAVIPSIIAEAALALGYPGIVRDIARESLGLCSDILLCAIKENDTGTLGIITENAELLVLRDFFLPGINYNGSRSRVKYVFGCAPAAPLLELLRESFTCADDVRLEVLGESCDMKEYPSPRQIFEAAGKILGGKSAEEALVFCLGDEPEKKLGFIMSDICSPRLFNIDPPYFFTGQPISGDYKRALRARMDERLSRLREFSELIAGADLKVANISSCMCGMLSQLSADHAGIVGALLPLFPEKLILTGAGLNINTIRLIQEKYTGEIVYRFDSVGATVPDHVVREYSAQYIRMIRCNLKMEYGGSTDISENRLLPQILMRQKTTLLAEIFRSKLFDRETVDSMVRFSVKNRLHNVIKLMGTLELDL